ncbi:hypothetical protein NDU88_006585 [Pleurodeles waltl]|uniref:Uncharacterized protein n=1 Tax=Pleurodeles waltl TaxID=8319 RepID=A0AAV7M0K5_PLEWA|nr:hypothetical protein NDU88_006585 [Pleurodeles waltl]
MISRRTRRAWRSGPLGELGPWQGGPQEEEDQDEAEDQGDQEELDYQKTQEGNDQQVHYDQIRRPQCTQLEGHRAPGPVEPEPGGLGSGGPAGTGGRGGTVQPSLGSPGGREPQASEGQDAQNQEH